MPILKPCISFELFRRIASVSTVKIKSYADSGHPCLIPLVISYVFEINPLFFTLNLGLSYNICIHLIKCGPKLRACNVSSIKTILQCRSKAFSKYKKIDSCFVNDRVYIYVSLNEAHLYKCWLNLRSIYHQCVLNLNDCSSFLYQSIRRT